MNKLALAFVPLILFAQPPLPDLHWRMIGPFRGGRTPSAIGVPTQPNVFYIGPNDGGVWKSTDYGNTWRPIFDDQPTGSIGAIAVAHSDPNVIYVGSGEALQRPDLSTGDGIYKSTDAGKTWTHLGLRDGQQISSLAIDPQDPNRVFVAVLGHPYGPNEERGVFRTTDGGQTWQKVLYKDENTGARQVEFDPTNPRKLYAILWASRQFPWEASANGPGSGLFISTDGGTNWRQLLLGLPTFEDGLGPMSFAIAPSNPRRMYLRVEARSKSGFYRSDDAGENWTLSSAEQRVIGRGSDTSSIKVDPRDPDTVFVANTSTYKSTDAGKTFTAIKGAPGGDDYQSIWISPLNPNIMILGVDQGATITVNGGETWSSWYNQPTAQFYHVITDSQFPYWVYGGQQESGSVAIKSRGDWGEITERDWHTVGVEEYGYIAPDPLDPAIIYGGKATRFDTRTGDVQNIAPDPIRNGKYRYVRTMPIIFSPVDPHVLFLASNVLFKTTTGGHTWQVISPDLTRETYETPKSMGIFAQFDPEKGKHRGVIYCVAPSRKELNTIWAGTDDGLIQVTHDAGAHWHNVTPPDLTPWSKVSQLDASYFDNATVYASINRFRLDDLAPYIYRTHDAGKTWKKITDGIPENEVVNTVREDPVRKGMLFAGTERAVYVSFDDGDHWQSLRLNMPATSIRDLVIHNDDVVIGTHGRSFWILDDIAPLRQLNGQLTTQLFKPAVAYRIQRDRNTDTPLPPETPAGQNPADGAIIDYSIANTVGIEFHRDRPTPPVTLEIFDAQGKSIRKFSSADHPDPVDAREYPYPSYWFRPARTLSSGPGMHRWIWDLRLPPPGALSHEFPMTAVPHATPQAPLGPFVLPGTYTLKLTVDGKTYTQPLTVKMDPRVKTPLPALTEQFTLASRLWTAMNTDFAAIEKIRQLRAAIPAKENETTGALTEAVQSLDKKLAALAGTGGGGRGGRGNAPSTTLSRLNAELAELLGILTDSDQPPTTQASTAVTTLTKSLDALLAQWSQIESKDIPALNADLAKSNLPPLKPQP